MSNLQSPHHILVIEPDKLLAESYRRAFQEVGIDVDWESNAQGAVDSVDKKKPELIILELQLPGNNGIEFIHELRSYPDWQTIPIMILTLVPEHEAGLSQEIRDQFGIVDYHYKPQTSLEKILHLVEARLNEVK